MQQPPTPAQGNTITLQELAEELGRDWRAMRELCRAQQVFARTPDTVVSASNADRLREAHRDKERRNAQLRSIPSDARRPKSKADAYAEAAYRQWPGELGVDVIARQWAEQMFEVAEAVVWWRAGMRGQDAALAGLLREFGVQPHHLAVVVRGDTMLFRLIDQGMAPEMIARLLRQEGHLV
ncbi:hypothetical protein [Actinosynnema sp. NPDC023587]|uniref:hypothetical protein n=1 Tax=Actinosynnema sp. NPDC023587 TaxID=3154695 RepID=UPI0033FD76CA